MSNQHPAILGESLYQNPLQGPDGTIRSAFEDITDAEARARQTIWDWEGVIPSEPDLIADEIMATGAMIERSSPTMARYLARHCRQLASGYSELDGSAVLLYLSHSLPTVIDDLNTEPALGEVDSSTKQSFKVMEKIAGLHVPLSEQEQRDKIESDVLPLMLDSFEMFYRLTGLFMNLQREVPELLVSADEVAVLRLAHVMQACAEHVSVYDFPTFAGWLGQKGGLPLYNRDYYRSTGVKVKERDVLRADHAVLELAGLSVSGYFKSAKGDPEFNFDKLRDFIDYCQAQDDSSAEQRVSYQDAAQVAAFFVCNAQSKALAESKQDIDMILAKRAVQIQRHGLPSTADAMVYAYEFVSKNFS